MKKYNLLKVIAITIFAAWLLTLIVPGSYVDYTGKVTTSTIAGVGVWGLLSNINISIAYFNNIAIFIVALACFYAVINKCQVYNTFVSKVASIFKEKERLLVIITTLFFGLLSIVVNDFMILLVFVPFVYKIMSELSIDKKIILSSTLVAGLIGSMCGIYNSTLFNIFNIKINTLLLVKVILFVISIAVLIILTAPKRKVKKAATKSSKKATTKSEVKEKIVKKVASKTKEKKVKKSLYAILTLLFGTLGINKFYAGKVKSGILCILFAWTGIPTILSIAEFITVLTEKADKNGNIEVTSKRRVNVRFAVLLILFVLFVIGSIIPWEKLIENLKVFSNINAFIAKITIGDYNLFGNIIGLPVSIDAVTGASSGVIAVFGTWAMGDITILLLVLTVIISIANNMKTDELISTVTNSIKEVLPVAITAMLVSIVLVIMVTSGITVTLANLILSITKSFNIGTSMLVAIINSVLTADFYYLVSTVGTVFTAVITNKDYYGVIAFILQSIYNVMMIIAPTSVGLVIGLYYLDIPYNKWLKFIWKFLLALLIIIVITAVVIYVLV